ncbi:MAG TPA: hypothetical protein VF209_03400 [Patescibacteria group bacterium]
MYVGPEQIIQRFYRQDGSPIEWSKRGTSVTPGYLHKGNEPGVPLAIKSLKGHEHFRSILDYFDAINNLKKEKKILEEYAYACPYFVKLIDSSTDPNGDVKELYLERLQPLELHLNFIRAQGLPNLLSIAQQMSMYLTFVHSEKYIDNDLKLENFGIDYENGLTLKRFDFGNFESQDQEPGINVVGSPRYLPLYKFNEGISVATLLKADIFALALNFYDLLTNSQRTKEQKPENMSVNDWLARVISHNHGVQFTTQDLLYITNGDEQAAQNLTTTLNVVLTKALSDDETQAYENVAELYYDFISCFQDYLTPEQFTQLLI